MDSSRDVTGSFVPPPSGEEEPSLKKRKNAPDSIEAKTAEAAQNALEEEQEETPPAKLPPSLKRERDSEEQTLEISADLSTGISSTKKSKEKTKHIAHKTLPYQSHFPEETTPLLKDITNIGAQNKLKKAADTILEKFTDKKIRERVLILASTIPADQRTQFFDKVSLYIELSPKSLKFLAKIPPEQRVACMVELREYLESITNDKDKDNLTSWVFEEIPVNILQETLLEVKLISSTLTNAQEMYFLLFSVILKSREEHTDPEQLKQKQTVKSLLQDITDGYVVAGLLYSTFDSLDNNELKDVIIQAKPLLATISKLLQNRPGPRNLEEKGKIAEAIATVVKTLTEVIPEKRESAIAVINRIVQSPYDLWGAIDPEFLSTTTLEQVDNALVHIDRFMNAYANTKNIDSIFKAFVKIPSEEISDVISKAAILINGRTDGREISYILKAVAETPAEQREDVLKHVGKLLHHMKPNTIEWSNLSSYFKEIATTPQEKRNDAISAVIPLLQGQLNQNEIINLLAFAANNSSQAKEAMTFARSLLQNFDNFYVGDIDKIVTTLAGVPVEDRQNVLTQSKPLLELLRGPQIYLENPSYGSYVNEILKLVAKIKPEERQDVRAKAMANLQMQPANIDDIKAIVSAISAIEAEQRDNMIDYARRISVGNWTNSPLFANSRTQHLAQVLRAIKEIDPEERVHVLESALFNINDNTSYHDRIYYIRYHNSYKLTLAQEEIKKRPIELLQALCEQFQQHRAYQLRVTFKGEKGEDAGGLGRVFVSELFDALKTKLDFSEKDNGLFTPTPKTSPTDEMKKAYNDIGRLMMFCLNATTQYPIGMLFDLSVFIAITKFTKNHLEHPIEELVTNDESFNELLSIYQDMNGVNESESASLKWINDNKNKPAEKQMIQDMMIDTLGPILEIAKGMKDAPFKGTTLEDVIEIGATDLSKELQGTVDKTLILSSLTFDPNIAQEKQNWMRDWIQNAEDKKLGQFLYAMTGSPALGKKALLIAQIEGEKTIFHTCANSVDLPLDVLESQEKFNLNLDNVLIGGFTIA